ncbi:MAG: FAD-binding oxidoreductase [Chloroflexota bacterium]|nr:FAD-binding oxidoreductase [Chloroflexota bacterium]
MSGGIHEMERSRIVSSSDPDYDSKRSTFNAMIDRRPLEIHVCAEADDVVAAVRRARELRVPVSIRGGGHSVAGQCIGDGALVVDLAGMRRVVVDPAARAAVAEGGATWEDYDTATQRFGLASTGGTFTDTGIAGLTLGGGIGYLMGTQGFTVDTLTGVRLVTAAGEIVRASEAENADLFWAVRGAGANFGVVVEFEYRLQPVSEVYGGMISYPMSAAAEILRVTRDLAAEAPDELTLQCIVGRRTADTTVLACFQGPKEDGERLLRPLRQALPVAIDALRSRSYAEMQATNALLPFGLRHYWKGHFLRSLPDDLVEMSADHVAHRPDSGFDTLLVEFIGGAPLRVAVGAMAFNQRQARVNASALGIWANREADDEHVAWARAYATGIAPHATGAEYVNYMAEDVHADRLRASYGDTKFARLQELKRQYDPDNVFRFNQNIMPSARK